MTRAQLDRAKLKALAVIIRLLIHILWQLRRRRKMKPHLDVHSGVFNASEQCARELDELIKNL